jgi:MFS family permease
VTGPAPATGSTAQTWGLYLAFGALGYVITGLGVILPELRLERDLPRGEAALYPSGFALGLIVVGLLGDRIARRLGRSAIPAAMAALATGALILALGTGRLDTGLGAVLLGLGGAGLVQLGPVALRSLHGRRSTVAISRANAVASAGSVLVPLVVGLALGAGLGWRRPRRRTPATRSRCSDRGDRGRAGRGTTRTARSRRRACSRCPSGGPSSRTCR